MPDAQQLGLLNVNLLGIIKKAFFPSSLKSIESSQPPAGPGDLYMPGDVNGFSLSVGFEKFWVTQTSSVPNFRDIQTLYPDAYNLLELLGYADNLTT